MAQVIKIKGIPGLQRALFQFNAKLGTKVTQLALKKGAAYMQGKIKAAAPVKTGRIKRSVRVRVSKIKKVSTTGSVGVYIIVGGGKRDSKRGAYYAKWVEYGYQHGSRLITGSQAVQRGIISQEDYRNRRLSNLQRALAKRRPGKKIVVPGIRLRAGGQDIAGQHFTQRAFDANSKSALDLIIAASEAALKAAARENNLKVR